MLLKRKREKEGKGKTKALCRVPSTEPRKARQGTRSFPLQTLARYAAIPPRPRLRHACCHGDSRAHATGGGTVRGESSRGTGGECGQGIQAGSKLILIHRIDGKSNIEQYHYITK